MRRFSVAEDDSFTSGWSGNRLANTVFMPGWGCLKEFVEKVWILNYIKGLMQLPCHNLCHRVKAMAGGHVDAEVSVIIPAVHTWRKETFCWIIREKRTPAQTFFWYSLRHWGDMCKPGPQPAHCLCSLPTGRRSPGETEFKLSQHNPILLVKNTKTVICCAHCLMQTSLRRQIV